MKKGEEGFSWEAGGGRSCGRCAVGPRRSRRSPHWSWPRGTGSAQSRQCSASAQLPRCQMCPYRTARTSGSGERARGHQGGDSHSRTPSACWRFPGPVTAAGPDTEPPLAPAPGWGWVRAGPASGDARSDSRCQARQRCWTPGPSQRHCRGTPTPTIPAETLSLGIRGLPGTGASSPLPSPSLAQHCAFPGVLLVFWIKFIPGEKIQSLPRTRGSRSPSCPVPSRGDVAAVPARPAPTAPTSLCLPRCSSHGP